MQATKAVLRYNSITIDEFVDQKLNNEIKFVKKYIDFIV